MTIKAILFDMDGVLIDAKDWHYEALNKALVHFDFDPIPREDHVRTFDGLSTMQKMEIHPQTKDKGKDLHRAINDKKQELTFEVIRENCRPYKQHIDTLARIKEQGFKLGCCSNSIKASVEMMLRSAEIMDFFDIILSNQDVDNPKPEPDIYNKAMEELGVSPYETLICEDNIRGMTAALQSESFVLEIGTIDDVNETNIREAIERIETGKSPQLLRPKIRTAYLSDMTGGWFVGNFFPNILQTKDFEVAVKKYNAGDKEDWHVHRVGTEITLVLGGSARMAGKIIKDGEIILLEPGEGTSFEALDDLTTVVVKSPSTMGDKYEK